MLIFSVVCNDICAARSVGYNRGTFIKDYKFWQDGNQAKEIYGINFLEEKLDYIHNNPVEEMIVSKPEDYMLSSARNYAEMENLLDVCLITKRWKSIE